MPTRREELLDAAVTVLAVRGARELTHRAVDREAGLPTGSASNVFRTRAELIEGIFEYLIEQELANLSSRTPEATGAAVDEAYLVVFYAAAIEYALGEGQRLTLARKALFMEAATDASARERLERMSQFWWTVGADLLRRAGAPQPVARSRLLLAYADGIITDQLSRPQDRFDPAAAIAPAVHGVLTIPQPRRE